MPPSRIHTQHTIPYVMSGNTRHELRGLGACPPNGWLNPTMKHTGQASGSELCKIVRFCSTLNDVCDAFVVKICKQCLQSANCFNFWGTSQTPTTASPLDPTVGLPSHRSSGPQMNIRHCM